MLPGIQRVVQSMIRKKLVTVLLIRVILKSVLYR